MEPNSREENRRIFRQELFTLKEEGYLSANIVETVAKAHQQYHHDILNENETKNSLPPEKTIVQKPVKVKPKKVKKTFTPEEVRERNITWSLNIGVIFLLIGALFVATSNWESMTSLMKSGSIAIVALLFYGIALLTKKVLHLDKTAFAFIVLGSLFLPIFTLSLGWFGLLGSYLSISGEGHYILGMMGCFLPIIVYVLFANNLKSRLFVWFTFVSIAAGAAFLLAGLKLTIDYFYLGLMVFNALFIFVYHQIKNREDFKLYSKEFVPFVQVNLVLGTLFMLFLFDDKVLYSFNLLLTAIIYLSMIFVSGRKEYHFVFSIMLVYGFYQLIEHSILESFGAVVYALLGFGMVVVPKVIKDNFSLNKAFQYTSAVISGIAFIYISFEGILLRAGNPSIVLMLAYFIIAANFIYLSENGPLRLFPYLSSLFMASAIYEAISLSVEPFKNIHFPFSLFVAGFILFMVFGILQLTKYLKVIQASSKDVGIALMAIGIITAMNFLYWREVGVMLLMLAIIAFMVHKKENRLIYQESALWILPSSLGFSIVAFGEEVNANFPDYYQQFGFAVNFSLAAIVVLLSSIVWKKVNNGRLDLTSFYIAQILYTFSIIHTIVSPVNQIWVQQLVLLIGVGMYFLFYKRIGTKWVPYLLGITTLLFYFSVIHSISLKFPFSPLVDSMIGPTSAVLMLFIAFLYRKKDGKLSSGFAWIGHCIYPIALIYTLVAYNNYACLSFILAGFVYGISTRLAAIEWKTKAFLYGSFTALLFVIGTGLDNLIVQYFGHYEFPITSGLIFIFWFIANHAFKKRTFYYLVPFSLLGLVNTLMTYPFDYLPYIVTLIYAGGLLFYLHLVKGDLLGIIPLFLTFLATVEFSFFSEMNNTQNLLLAGGLGILLSLIGQINYKLLVKGGKKLQDTQIDGYTFISLLFFSYMYYFENQSMWSNALPGVLIAVLIIIQRKRVPLDYSVFMVILGTVFLLQPYYSIISDLNVPHLWDREVYVLPWILVVIFIRLKLHGRFVNISKPLEWGVLLVVSLLLIQDGLAGNTIYDGIILGTLSLAAMLAGMFLQLKAYFFVGSGVLLLNVCLQTRPYWGNMPWWGYLLIVGFILITVASFNEWNKQKTQKGQSTFITLLKEKAISKIKQWD
jgi:hypothetical protein